MPSSSRAGMERKNSPKPVHPTNERKRRATGLVPRLMSFQQQDRNKLNGRTRVAEERATEHKG